MASAPNPRTPQRAMTRGFRFSLHIPPALVVAVVLGSLGAAAWWLLLPGTDTSLADAEPVPSTVEELAGSDPAQAASPTPTAAVAPKAVALLPAAEHVVAVPITRPNAAGTDSKFKKLLILDAMGGAKKENRVWSEEVWKLAKSSGAWDEYRDLLGRSLQKFAAGKTTADVMANPAAAAALVRHAFLVSAPAALLNPLCGNEETRAFLHWLLENPEAMQAFLLPLSPHDDPAQALKLWARLAAESPSAQTDYRELAIACALVFDRTITAPHDRYGGPLEPVARFRHFKENDEAGRLIGKIRTMPAADLVWAVGVPVSPSELAWAVKKTAYRRRNWGVAYDDVKYDMEKAVEGTNAYDEYTFAEILKKGGICSDQSYFSAGTACAHGVPAAILTGDGSRGPHAWITWLADEGEWKFSGRMGGYPAGSSLNPQTGESISEEEFLRRNDRRSASPAQVTKSRLALWLAGAFANEPARAFDFIEEAVQTAPRLPDAAAALLAHWTEHRRADEVAEWNELISGLRKHFRDCAPLMAAVSEAENQYVFPRSDSRDVIKRLRREASKTGDTSTARAGVEADPGRLTDGLRRQAEVLLKKSDPAAIRSIYRRALADYGNNPASFKAISEDYFSFFADDPELAPKVCYELESLCRRKVGRGKGDWFDIMAQNSAWMLVAGCYRTAGDTAKADKITRDCESRTKTAQKRAI